MRRPSLVVLVLALAWWISPTAPAEPKGCLGGLLPNLQTVVPKHLGIQNKQQREILRFTNGIANRGPGPWRMRPEPPPGTDTLVTNAIQEILDADGDKVCEKLVSTFEFHPEHNHWHIGDVALFELRKAKDDGTGGAWGKPFVNDQGQAQSIKTTFLIDWYKLDDNSPTTERVYWECATSFQGISRGWVDQYHQELEGQQLDLTGAPVGVYYLVSTGVGQLPAPARQQRERLDPRDRPLAVRHPGMCGEQATNR